MLIATIAARNYLAQVRVLARSFRACNPDGHVVALVIDGPGPGMGSDEPFEVVTPEALAIEPAELSRMATVYDVTELATALKPWLLDHLLDRGEPAVTYLDPDIEVFASLADLDALAQRHSIVLTPHRLEPTPDDEFEPREQAIVSAGAYNLGFIAVSAAAKPFLSWWSDHCRRDCVVDLASGLFVDQRWIDMAVTYFEHKVVRDRGCNVAYWNLDERPLSRDAEGGYHAGDAPLRFFHYSGFDPARPYVLTKHQAGRPRVLLSEAPALRELCEHYAARLEDEGWRDARKVKYGLDRAVNGMRLDRYARRAFAQELRWRERGLAPDRGSVDALGDPFDPAGIDAFIATLRSPPLLSEFPRISRYLLSLYWHRQELHYAFPSLKGLEGNHFLWWMKEMGQYELDVPAELAPTEADLEPDPEPIRPLRSGVRVVGYFSAELGIGELGRGMLSALDALGEPHVIFHERDTISRQGHDDVRTSGDGADFDLNLVCVNADRFPSVLDRLGASFARHRRTIGVWAWEVEEFPAWMAASQELLDEVWTPSAHSSRAIGTAVEKPVVTFPLPVVERPSSGRGRAALGLPDGFLFLFSFDAYSGIERKNPAAAVEAFCRAFSPGEGPQLVIKSINGHTNLAALERLRLLARDRPDIRVVDGYLDPPDQQALVRSCDAYVSLHRAEGFGYTLAEAMLAGKPAIGTAYSGNLEFMDETNSFLVRYEMTPIARGCDPYPSSSRWAEPDVEHAAELMRRVVEDPTGAAAVAERGRRTIVERHSPAACGPTLAARLAAARAAAVVVHPASPSPTRLGRLGGLGGLRLEPIVTRLRRLRP